MVLPATTTVFPVIDSLGVGKGVHPNYLHGFEVQVTGTVARQAEGLQRMPKLFINEPLKRALVPTFIRFVSHDPCWYGLCRHRSGDPVALCQRAAHAQ